MFNSNTNGLDRIVRVVLGAAMIAAFFIFPGLGLWGWALWFGAVLIATAAIGWCPIYQVLGLSTKGRRKNA